MDITLNRTQIGQLIRIYTQFSEVENFKIKQTNDNGIGPVITVNFNLFDTQAPTQVDITDVSTW